MLAGRALDTADARCQSSDFRLPYRLLMLFMVIVHHGIGIFLRIAGNRAGPESILTAKHLFNKLMCSTLIFAGEIEINIGLFVALKAQKSFKGDVLALFDHLHFALRTCLGRQIVTGSVFTADIKYGVVAIRADIMRRQRIDFRNTTECGHKRRAHRTSGTDYIAIGIGLTNQFAGDIVHDGKAIITDRIQFFFDPVFDQFRQLSVLTVNRLSRCPGAFDQNLLGLFNERRE